MTEKCEDSPPTITLYSGAAGSDLPEGARVTRDVTNRITRVKVGQRYRVHTDRELIQRIGLERSMSYG